jgi:hypothetical protein
MKIERHETGPRMSKAVIHGDTVYLGEDKRDWTSPREIVQFPVSQPRRCTREWLRLLERAQSCDHLRRTVAIANRAPRGFGRNLPSRRHLQPDR